MKFLTKIEAAKKHEDLTSSIEKSLNDALAGAKKLQAAVKGDAFLEGCGEMLATFIEKALGTHKDKQIGNLDYVKAMLDDDKRYLKK
jgi:hypothetical protein